MSEVKPFHESVVEIVSDCFCDFYTSFGEGLNFLPASTKLINNLELIEELIKHTKISAKESGEMIKEFEKIAGDFESNNRSILSLSMFVNAKEIKERLANIIFSLKCKCRKYSSS